MKILAPLKDYRGELLGAIIEVSKAELAIITAGYASSYMGNLNAGDAFAIEKRFEHSHRIVRKAEEALKLPGVLRSLADTIEFVCPKIESLRDETEPDSWSDEKK